MRTVQAVSAFILAGGAAAAHPGHVGSLDGHSHWLALGLGAAAVAAALLLVRAAFRRLAARSA
jgi:hypothetical protein